MNTAKQNLDENQKLEAMQKACDSAGFLVSNLRVTLQDSKAVEGVLLLDLIQQAADLKQKVNALHVAMAVDAANSQ